MSLTTQKASSPVGLYLEWKGTHEDGRIQTWDKENEKNINYKKFQFIPFDTLYSVRGYNEASKAGVRANEVKSVQSEDLEVYAGFKNRTPLVSGKWKDIKDAVRGHGGKFAICAYGIGKLLNGETGTICVVFSGSGSGAWFDLQKSAGGSLEGKLITWDGSTNEGQKGSTKYDIPVLKASEPSDGELDKAKAADLEFQAYLKAQKASQGRPADDLGDDPPEAYSTAVAANATEDDDIPF
tara:strand:- start:2561 stop:3277 length:717 start_codon:yes stop_codon:yes gene_type:complete